MVDPLSLIHPAGAHRLKGQVLLTVSLILMRREETHLRVNFVNAS